MDEFKRFQEVVKNYAEAYASFEQLQEEGITFIPEKGDQKTGVVGEAYIFKYLDKKGYKNLEFGKTSQESWDIKFTDKGEEKLVQVKTVSDFSETKIISHILPGFDILYLVKLNEKLYPVKILKVTTSRKWPDIKHKAFPKKDFTYKNYKFETIDETEDFMYLLNMKKSF